MRFSIAVYPTVFLKTVIIESRVMIADMSDACVVLCSVAGKLVPASGFLDVLRLVFAFFKFL